jgi:hypothetical protein
MITLDSGPRMAREVWAEPVMALKAYSADGEEKSVSAAWFTSTNTLEQRDAMQQ